MLARAIPRYGQNAGLRACGACLIGLLALAGPGSAWAQGTVVYRCPGPPVLYTDQLTPDQAKAQGCRTIEAAPVTVLQPPRKPAARPATPAPAAGSGNGADTRVAPDAQRARDRDARRILETELQREQVRLADLKRAYNDGQPERQGDERNFQRYLDRVAEMKASIARTEGDIAALQRELAKLAPAP